MNVVASSTGNLVRARVGRRMSVLHLLALEAQMEFKRLLRNPSFCVPIIAFPLMFYVLFAIVMGPPPGTGGIARRLLASYTVFGAMGPGLFGIGVTFALDRERGLLSLKRALPMPPGVYLGAKVLMAAAFAAVISLLLMVIAATAGQVVLEALQWGELFGLALLGVLPFCSLGLLVGTLIKGQAAPAILNLLYLPMSFLSGVIFPVSSLPHPLGWIAPLWPSYHLVQLAQRVVDGDRGQRTAAHVVAVAVEAAVLFALARRRMSKLS